MQWKFSHVRLREAGEAKLYCQWRDEARDIQIQRPALRWCREATTAHIVQWIGRRIGAALRGDVRAMGKKPPRLRFLQLQPDLPGFLWHLDLLWRTLLRLCANISANARGRQLSPICVWRDTVNPQ